MYVEMLQCVNTETRLLGNGYGKVYYSVRGYFAIAIVVLQLTVLALDSNIPLVTSTNLTSIHGPRD